MPSEVVTYVLSGYHKFCLGCWHPKNVLYVRLDSKLACLLGAKTCVPDKTCHGK